MFMAWVIVGTVLGATAAVIVWTLIVSLGAGWYGDRHHRGSASGH